MESQSRQGGRGDVPFRRSAREEKERPPPPPLKSRPHFLSFFFFFNSFFKVGKSAAGKCGAVPPWQGHRRRAQIGLDGSVVPCQPLCSRTAPGPTLPGPREGAQRRSGGEGAVKNRGPALALALDAIKKRASVSELQLARTMPRRR